MKYYTKLEYPLSDIILVGDENGLSHLHLNTGKGKRHFALQDDWREEPDFFSEVKKQLDQYFQGTRKTFSVALNPEGTDFQKMIWRRLRSIPYGTVVTYKDIATAVGKEKAARAVGMANSKNPIPLIIPCHRVVGADGSLTGFAHGLEIKEKLLQLEGVKRYKSSSQHPSFF